MLKAKVQFKSSSATKHLAKVEKQLEKVPQQALDFFKYKAPTPIRSGNARKNTTLQGKDTIQADYPYAKRLDNGYSSQAPNGMVKPTIAFVKQLVKDIVKGNK